jgi:hypothetical protein
MDIFKGLVACAKARPEKTVTGTVYLNITI